MRCSLGPSKKKVPKKLLTESRVGVKITKKKKNGKKNRGTVKMYQKLQSDSAHRCHVEVDRVLCDDARGKRERARDLEKTANGRSQQNKLSTSTGVGHKSLTKTLGLARGKISHVETCQRGATNNVYGKLGHQDGLGRGEAEAYCEDCEES